MLGYGGFRGSRGTVSMMMPVLGRRRNDPFKPSTRGQLHKGSESGRAYSGQMGSYKSFAQKRATQGGGAINFGKFDTGLKFGLGRWF